MNFINTKHEDAYSSYLGQKGYTLFKHELSAEQQTRIKNDLTIKPFVMGAPNPSAEAKVFPAYRESAGKYYLPHYYGVKHFGPPKEFRLSEGCDIDVPFHGQLRDYQAPVVQKFLDHCTQVQYGGGLLELYCAWGKTSASLYIISQLKKKTLVIVHKEFLMNQWIERIQQFLPTAKVGKIQGSTVDIEGKDIVIGMLQSLSMKDYPNAVFASFGLTIVDEVHHISSEVFSRALFKIVTKYMLGLSATMERKDGTTSVFKMFIGDVIYKSKRSNDREVVVRAIQYKTDDEEFNNSIYDWRGKPQYSSMISKLCEYNRRSEFILKVLGDLLREETNRQIMILAHNKNLLKYLHDAIEHRQMATVGYYVGGMKESALKETETKKVVIATYSMASEALDIKTLTTLIMATPKTDIEQSIGRILREKHSHPVVVDIVDSHDLFQNQWRKRKTFYKRENYKVIFTTSFHYHPHYHQWKVVLHPRGEGFGSSKHNAALTARAEDNDHDPDNDNDHDRDTEETVIEPCWLRK